MNARKAKKLRRFAEQMSVGRPERLYRKDENGTVRHSEKSTRALHKKLKRES